MRPDMDMSMCASLIATRAALVQSLNSGEFNAALVTTASAYQKQAPAGWVDPPAGTGIMKLRGLLAG